MADGKEPALPDELIQQLLNSLGVAAGQQVTIHVASMPTPEQAVNIAEDRFREGAEMLRQAFTLCGLEGPESWRNVSRGDLLANPKLSLKDKDILFDSSIYWERAEGNIRLVQMCPEDDMVTLTGCLGVVVTFPTYARGVLEFIKQRRGIKPEPPPLIQPTTRTIH